MGLYAPNYRLLTSKLLQPARQTLQEKRNTPGVKKGNTSASPVEPQTPASAPSKIGEEMIYKVGMITGYEMK